MKQATAAEVAALAAAAAQTSATRTLAPTAGIGITPRAAAAAAAMMAVNGLAGDRHPELTSRVRDTL
jgi:hypothetical protein